MKLTHSDLLGVAKIAIMAGYGANDFRQVVTDYKIPRLYYACFAYAYKCVLDDIFDKTDIEEGEE